MVWSYDLKNFLHKQTLYISIAHQKTSVADYNRILFSDVKILREVCEHRIEHKPVLLTYEENFLVWFIIKFINSYKWKGVISLFSWLNTGYVSDWSVISSKKYWYQHFENIPHVDISIELTIEFVVSTGIIIQFIFMVSNNKTVWNNYLRLDVQDY